MSISSSMMDALFGSYDIKVAQQWRDEDIRHREQEKQWYEDAILREIAWRNEDLDREHRVFKLANEKRMIDARSQQLIAIVRLSALLGTFTMAAIVELNVPKNFNPIIIAIYSGVAALEFLCMLMTTLICTLLLMAITRFVTHTLEEEVRALGTFELELNSPFNTYWLLRCENEWVMAYRIFFGGLTCFTVMIALIGCIQFQSSVIARVLVAVLCLISAVYWRCRIAGRWDFLIHSPNYIPLTPSSSGELTPKSIS